MEEKKEQVVLKAEDVKEGIYFTNSETCPSCRMIASKMDELAKCINIDKYDTATQEGLDKAAEYNIRSVPALICNGIDFVGIPNIVKIMHPVINLHKDD